MRRCLILLALAAALPAAAQPSRPLMPMLDAAGIAKSCDEGLARARDLVKAMAAKAGGAGFFAEWNRLEIAIEDTSGPISNFGNLHPDKVTRDAAAPCLQKYTAFQTEIFQDEKVFARLKDAKPADARETKLKKNLAEGFEDSGIALPAQKRARAKEIFTRLEELRLEFERNVGEDGTTVTFTPDEVEGLGEAFLGRQKRDAGGHYVMGLDEPSYSAFMVNARSEAARRRYFMARSKKGGARNLEILDEGFRLRKELAGLYGLPTYADYALRRKMVGSPAVVSKFLAEVKGAVTEVEKRELDELAAEKRRDRGEDARLQRWDVSYYEEKVRKARFRVDQEKYRAYFPTEKSMEFAMLVAETLYGVKFRRRRSRPGIPRCAISTWPTRKAASTWPASTSTSIRATASATARGTRACAAGARSRHGRRIRCSPPTSAATGSTRASARRCCTSSATPCTPCCRRPSTSRRREPR
jgi:thimet oligopeptidase